MLNPEITRQGVEFIAQNALFIEMAGSFVVGALTLKQRLAILKRDGEHCNFPVAHQCNGQKRIVGNNTHNLEVHHIVPQGWSKNAGFDDEWVDSPENTLTVCTNAHQRIIHPDTEVAILKYQYDKNSFKEMQEKRKDKMKFGERYWFSNFDDEMRTKAEQLTERAKKWGWKFPDKG